MKVLMVHNFYQSSAPSGEDVVFRNEIELLKQNGINIITYTKHNDEIMDYGLWDKFLLPIKNIWSSKTYREIKQLIKKEKPDIAHFHNIWYLISPSAYYACKDAGIPVVQTLHNFRIFCTNGLLMRNGHVCEECIQGEKDDRAWSEMIKNAVKYGCYRESRFYSLPVAITECYHWLKRTWVDKVDAYIALTEFGKKKFIEAGLPAGKIFVKPNFLTNPPEPDYLQQNYAVFIGRLSVEKGLNVLINAFQYLSTLSYKPLAKSHEPSPISHQPFHLKIIGDGPLRQTYMNMVKQSGLNNIEFTGKKSFNECMELLKGARFIIMPSLSYEGFPMAIRESFACGKPVIASNLGAMAELVDDGKTGLLFEPGNAKDLAEKMQWMFEHKEECLQMGRNARKVYEEKYTPEKNFEMIMSIYNTVIQRHKLKNKRSHTSHSTISQKWNANNSLSQRKKILQGVNFLPMTIRDSCLGVIPYIAKKSGDYFCLSNIHVVMESHRDPELKKALNSAAGVFADGMGTAGALKYLGYMFKDRVRGTDLMLRLCEYSAKKGVRIFLYGNTNATLHRLSEKLKILFPGLIICGTHSPSFRELSKEEDDEAVRIINSAQPDILFVSLGAPKQEKWMAAHKGRIKAVQLGVGAAFDYIAGNLKEAPDWMKSHYLEWLYRLPQQPKKTIYRMSLLPEFLIRLFIQKFWQ